MPAGLFVTVWVSSDSGEGCDPRSVCHSSAICSVVFSISSFQPPHEAGMAYPRPQNTEALRG